MVAGSEGLGRVRFEATRSPSASAPSRLVLILFDGGLSALVRHHPARSARPRWCSPPLGVLITTAPDRRRWRRTCSASPWSRRRSCSAPSSPVDRTPPPLSLGACAARPHRARPPRPRPRSSCESGLNDPVAVILTIALTRRAGRARHRSRLAPRARGRPARASSPAAPAGRQPASAGRWLVRARAPAAAEPSCQWSPSRSPSSPSARPRSRTAAAFSPPTSRRRCHPRQRQAALSQRPGLRVHDAVAWLGQVVMFLVLGLLSFPRGSFAVGGAGARARARPRRRRSPAGDAAVPSCPSASTWREIVFVGWVGLRGAVPIILAIYPVLAGAPNSHHLFDIVFFIVVVSLVRPRVDGALEPRASSASAGGRAPPAAVLEIASTLPLRSSAVRSTCSRRRRSPARIADVPFPPDSAVMLIVRAEELIAARRHRAPRPRPRLRLLPPRPPHD